ncbi:5-dehydro-2-deoxygluconokinase [Alicyclobacillus curvatus]|nr:5-dehydro-2-deoxygluconokinase [Alicyclobacillus curvatus]
MTQPEVYTLGRLIVDLYASEIGVGLDEVGSFRKYLGGSAANTAIGLARHGASVGLISRVGPDDFGVYLRNQLQKERVDTEMVNVDRKFPTGLAFAALFPPNDSKVLFYRKPCADANLSLGDIRFDKLKNARMLVVACTALAVSPGREAALAALEANRAAGGINVLDIDFRPIFWADEAEAKLYYRAAIRMSDVVMANEPELEFAGGSAHPAEAAANLLDLGVKEVVAKRGSEGCLYFSPSGNLQVPAVPVDVLNTLGAGDGFGAAYTFGLLQGWDVQRRLEYAAAAGAIVVSRHSCSEAMPTRKEVEDLLAANVKGASS